MTEIHTLEGFDEDTIAPLSHRWEARCSCYDPAQDGGGFRGFGATAVEAINSVLDHIIEGDATTVVIHTGDPDQVLAAKSEGYDEAVRQMIGGMEVRAWAVDKIVEILDGYTPAALRSKVVRRGLAEVIADALVSEANLSIQDDAALASRPPVPVTPAPTPEWQYGYTPARGYHASVCDSFTGDPSECNCEEPGQVGTRSRRSPVPPSTPTPDVAKLLAEYDEIEALDPVRLATTKRKAAFARRLVTALRASAPAPFRPTREEGGDADQA